MSELTLYEKIAQALVPAYVIWEDEDLIAFLTPFPNTEGFTVVTFKVNPGNYVFSLNDDKYNDLLHAAKVVAHKIENSLGVTRVGMVVDGTGVPHAHILLSPFNKYIEGAQISPSHNSVIFNESYPGYVTSADGPRMTEEKLKEIQEKIRSAA